MRRKQSYSTSELLPVAKGFAGAVDVAKGLGVVAGAGAKGFEAVGVEPNGDAVDPKGDGAGANGDGFDTEAAKEEVVDAGAKGELACVPNEFVAFC